MSGREHVDKAKTKPGDVKAATAEMVRLTADEQRRCRIEGFKMAMRIIDSSYAHEGALAWEAYDELVHQARRRWGEAFDD